MTIEKLISYGSITQEIADKLEVLVKSKYNIFISGGTGSGKTTFLNALSNYIPKDERVITIEDSAELQITGIENLVSLETRNANTSGICHTMSLSLFSHPSDRYDYKALALKPASDTAERIVSAGRSVVIVNVLSGDFKSIDHASSFTNLFNLAPIAATHPPHLAFVLNFNVAISLLII